jgi:Raf kinase inhibitor-like YbhB/YbcL family protein
MNKGIRGEICSLVFMGMVILGGCASSQNNVAPEASVKTAEVTEETVQESAATETAKPDEIEEKVTESTASESDVTSTDAEPTDAEPAEAEPAEAVDLLATLPTFEVGSDDLADGVWIDDTGSNSRGQNISPELHWDGVEGAVTYNIYMIDESAWGWLHWQAEGISDDHLERGVCSEAGGVIGTNAGGEDIYARYLGPYPPDGIHTYNVYVVALQDTSAELRVKFNRSGNDIKTIIEGLDVKADGNNGNVLGYGMIEGTFSAN